MRRVSGRQGERVRAHEHLALAVADRERRPLPRRHQRARVPGEDRGQGEGPVHPLERRGEGLCGAAPLREVPIHQAHEGFGVGFRLELGALGLEFGAQLGVVLDDAVVDRR
jgi:hypothetical protein